MTDTNVASEKPDGVELFVDAMAHLGMRKYSSVQLLLALIVMLAIIPFVESHRDGDLIATVLMTAVLLSAVIATGSRRRVRIFAVALVTPAVLSRWVAHYFPEAIPNAVIAVASALFIGFVIVNLLRFVMQSRVVNIDVLCAASAAYLMMGLLWAFGYILASDVSADAFHFTDPSSSPHQLAGFEAMYFSFASLSTLGCSDIIPTSNGARLLTMTEAIAGIFFMTILIARLVTLYSSTTKRTKER